MEVKFDYKNNILTVNISGEIDHHAASAVRNEIDEMIMSAHPASLILNYDGITFMDSSGIGIAIGRYNLMKKMNGKMYIIANDKNTERILRMSGIFEIIKKADSVHAVTGLKKDRAAGGDNSGN